MKINENLRTLGISPAVFCRQKTPHDETNIARIKMMQHLKINSCNITISQPQHHEIANVTHYSTNRKESK
jgi:hypothetical protein